MKPLTINIFFTTFSIKNTSSLLNSLKDHLTIFPKVKFDLTINIIFQSSESEFLNLLQWINFPQFQVNLIHPAEVKKLESKYAAFIEEANCNTSVNSIQRGRIQQQIYIKEYYSIFQNSIIWQVDDDMLFKSFKIVGNKIILGDEVDFFGTLLELHSRYKYKFDALIAKSNYTPPIPSLLYTLNQLTDILTNQYIQADVVHNEEYHDYYFSASETGYYNVKLHEKEDRNTLVKRILNGQPITRPVMQKQFIESSNDPCFLRGGNFIVFNTEIFLTVPHLGFVFNQDEPARRSDMIHATLALDLGYKIIENHQLILVHNRCFEEYGFENNIHDYYSDLIGNMVLIRLHKSVKEVNQRLSFHKKHLAEIILLFEQYNLKNEYKIEFESLQNLSRLVRELKWKDIEPKYNEFLENYSKIRTRENLCKLQL